MTGTPDLAAAVAAEIDGLHQFFTAWFLGSCPRDSFGRCSEALAADFVQVDPAGRLRRRDELLDALQAAHGCYAGLSFAIQIERTQVRLLPGDLALATYEEWQQFGERRSGRRSSTLFSRGRGPLGVVWRHLHETWMLGRS